jgi:KDO2-lipid IV(A) lauroyltransferase
MLVDQKMNEGIAVPFFGRPAMTATVAAAFALHFRCPVLVGHVRRIGPARFRVFVGPPLALPDTGHRSNDIVTLTHMITAELERRIRSYPEGWLWLHRRWPKESV